MDRSTESVTLQERETIYRNTINLTIKFFVCALQHLRSGSNFECAYRTHLMAAQGFYHHLLLRIQKEFNLHLSCAIDFVYSPNRDWGVGKYLIRSNYNIPINIINHLERLSRCTVAQHYLTLRFHFLLARYIST